MQEDSNKNARGTKHTWELGQKIHLGLETSWAPMPKMLIINKKKFMQQQEDLNNNPRGIDQQFGEAKQQCKKSQ